MTMMPLPLPRLLRVTMLMLFHTRDMPLDFLLIFAPLIRAQWRARRLLLLLANSL